MKIIDFKTVSEASEVHDFLSFEAGVTFAEQQLHPFIVELLDWLKEQPILICQTTNGHQWASSYTCGGYFTTQQLLEEFINSKTK